jgi:hypothetical protein
MDHHPRCQPDADAVRNGIHGLLPGRRWGVRILLLFIFLTGCNSTPPAPRSLDSATPTSSASLTPALEQTGSPAPQQPGLPALTLPTSTAVLALVEGDLLPDILPEAIPSPVPDPLKFVFPSPAPAPVSAWRPPLYPTPWALSPYDHFYFARPIAADEVNWPLWDYRYGGTFFEDIIHTGIDIVVDKGTPVLAAGSGKVTWAGYGLYRGVEDTSDPYGLAVAIHHDFGYAGQSLYTIYAHLDRVDVVVGQYVEVGESLGLSGDTGHVTGPHLHFEVRLGEAGFFTTRNPELWLAPPQGWGVLAGRISDSNGHLRPGQVVIVHSISSGQNWLAKTYGGEAANSDAYYRENLVISDLPAGRYEIRIAYQGYNYVLEIDILPGIVSYFSLRGHLGYSTALPPEPGDDFDPSSEATQTPPTSP